VAQVKINKIPKLRPKMTITTYQIYSTVPVYYCKQL